MLTRIWETWWYLGGSVSSIISLGASSLASAKVMPTLTPRTLASMLAATTQAFLVRRLVIASGLPRSSGLACCSTVAKQELRSICITNGSARLMGSCKVGCCIFRLHGAVGLVGYVN